MNEEQRLAAELQRQFGGASVRCKLVSGMWVVELVHAGVTPATKQNYLGGLNRALTAITNTHPVWKYFFYARSDERFVVDGTLHTVAQTYDSEGISTTTLAAQDCYIDITAFDAEAMQLGLEDGITILARESRDANGQAVLDYQVGADYLWVEALGGNYGIRLNGTRQLPNGEIEITLGAR